MSTLKDVAALAQCSLTTASIVANGRGDEMHISPATQQRVAEAIQQLQYRPDRGAQLLRASLPDASLKAATRLPILIKHNN